MEDRRTLPSYIFVIFFNCIWLKILTTILLLEFSFPSVRSSVRPFVPIFDMHHTCLHHRYMLHTYRHTSSCTYASLSRSICICIIHTCIMYTRIMDTCTMDTCIMGTYIMDTWIMDTCIMDTSIMDTICIIDASAWVTRPERLKGAKDEVKEARRAAD